MSTKSLAPCAVAESDSRIIDSRKELADPCYQGEGRVIGSVHFCHGETDKRTYIFEFDLATVYFLPRGRNQRATAQYLDFAATGRTGPEYTQAARAESIRDGLGTQAFPGANPRTGCEH